MGERSATLLRGFRVQTYCRPRYWRAQEGLLEFNRSADISKIGEALRYTGVLTLLLFCLFTLLPCATAVITVAYVIGASGVSDLVRVSRSLLERPLCGTTRVLMILSFGELMVDR